MDAVPGSHLHLLFRAYQGEATVIAGLKFRRYSGNYQIRSALISDASSWTNSSWQTISDASHYFEIDWRASSAALANDGGLTLWIGGVQKAALTGTGSDNDTRGRHTNAVASTGSSYLRHQDEGVAATFVYPRKDIGGERSRGWQPRQVDHQRRYQRLPR